MGRAGPTQPDIDRAIMGQHAGLARLTYNVLGRANPCKEKRWHGIAHKSVGKSCRAGGS